MGLPAEPGWPFTDEQRSDAPTASRRPWFTAPAILQI
jgi:hypothetical protein